MAKDLFATMLFNACFFAVLAVGERVPVLSRTPDRMWDRIALSSPAAAAKTLSTHFDHSPSMTFTMYLQQSGLEQLDAVFNDVSDPASANWGKFLSKEELDDLVFASDEAFTAVENWLAPFPHTLRRTADSVIVSMSAEGVEAAFETSVEYFVHKHTGRSHLKISGTASLPADVQQHVHFIGGLSELWQHPDKKVPHSQSRSSTLADDPEPVDLEITPQLLREHYGIPADETNASPQNYQAIAAFYDWFSADALAEFNKNFSLPSPKITIQGADCVTNPDDKGKPCDAMESNLDVQYMTAIGAGVDTLFHNMNSSSWVLEFTEAAMHFEPMPLVVSISYGWAELKQCQIAFETCEKLGYDATAYVKRSNTGFQKLAVRGVSVLVADGDDGAENQGEDGSDPIDLTRWCGGSEWECYPEESTKCAELSLKATSGEYAGQACPWPIGMDGELCGWMYLGDLWEGDKALKALKKANPKCKLETFLDGSYGTHFYSSCTCDELASMDYKGTIDVTSEPFKYNASARIFYADFPTASPYVTSVGATLFKSTDGKTVSAEHVASIVDGAGITTGGGFSLVADRPAWQQEAVQGWVTGAPAAAKPPKGTYDPTKRGYPDITLNGHNYQVFGTKDANSTKCPCEIGGVDGTSASSPALAGMISLINGHLLAAKKPALGFLNPLLYAMSKESPETFDDITFGDNKCTRNFCMTFGYNATAGWDPVAGLGAPRYSKMKAYVLSKKEITV